jgi:hypothetical protein
MLRQRRPLDRLLRAGPHVAYRNDAAFALVRSHHDGDWDPAPAGEAQLPSEVTPLLQKGLRPQAGTP